MSWFDKLFGPNETTSQSDEPKTPVDTNDVYKRPKGKFRFPLNVDNVRVNHESKEQIEEHHSNHQQIQKPEYQHDTSGFVSDYVPRRQRRREKNGSFNSESHRDAVTPSYQPKRQKTTYDSMTEQKYQSYVPKREKPKFTSKDYQVHKPIFKASEVPSAIYGTKKPPENRPTFQPVKKLEGQKAIEKRPETPTHRKEDNTVNIENIYASQIVAEIRREREKKLRRQKEFQENRERIKLQESEIEKMMQQKDDVERIETETPLQIAHEPKQQLSLDVQENQEAQTELSTQDTPVENEVTMVEEDNEVITLTDADLVDDESDAFIEENVTFEEVQDDEDSDSDLELETIDGYDDLSEDTSFDDVTFEEIDADEVQEETHFESDDNKSFEDNEHQHANISPVEDTYKDVALSRAIEVQNNEFTGNIKDVKSLEPVLKPVMKERISPFNVVMTPSDKKKWMEAKRKIKEHQDIPNQVTTKPSVVEVATNESNVTNALTDQNTVPPKTEVERPIQKVQPSVEQKEKKRIGPKYLLPPVSLLRPEDKMTFDQEAIDAQAAQLNDAFYHFNVPATVENVVVGPSVTRFELSVEKGVKVSRITNLQDDIKMALAAKDIRIEAPIPGTSLVGVEVPNKETRNVNLSEVQLSKKLKFAESHLSVALGVRINNEPMIMDIAKMPHGMIAGATGSGKSVAINSILVSLLYRNNPNELKLLLIDPKMVELAPYNDLPHLIAPVITDVKAATESLKWVVEEMERRYKVFADLHVRNITAYNQKAAYQDRMPKIVVVIDELADLMMVAPQDVEHAIARIAQKARACGIHLILATQRPSVNVITGLIKANVPTRIAFMVSSQVDSRTILDVGGAEKLLGNGDMLYLGNGMNKPIRIQGCYVSDDEIDQVVQYVKSQGEPNYLFQQETLLKKVSEQPKDELFDEICDYMIDEGHISTSLIQRRFQIGYNRAARIVDQLEELGYISGQNGSKPRAVLITEKQSEY